MPDSSPAKAKGRVSPRDDRSRKRIRRDESVSSELTKEYYIEKIIRIEEECAALEEQTKNVSRESDEHDVAEVLKMLLEASDNGHDELKDGSAVSHDTQIAEDEENVIKSRLHTLANVTGITFTTVRHEPVLDGNNQVRIRRYELSGLAFGLKFGLKFDVSETDMSVESLKVSLPDENKFELGEFVAHVEQSRSPQLFFQVLVQYAEKCDERREAFARIGADFPDVVCLPQADNGVWFCSLTTPDGYHLFDVSWLLGVAISGKVTSHLDLSACNGGETEDSLNKPSQFTAMARCVGASEAIYLLAQQIWKNKK